MFKPFNVFCSFKRERECKRERKCKRKSKSMYKHMHKHVREYVIERNTLKGLHLLLINIFTHTLAFTLTLLLQYIQR